MSKEISRRDFLRGFVAVLVMPGLAADGRGEPTGVRKIDLSRLPEQPPLAVTAQTDTVLAVRGPVFASAVKVADNLALSAAHIFGSRPEDEQCSDRYLIGRNNSANSIYQAVSPDSRNGHQPDITLMRTNGNVFPYQDLPDAQIAPQRVKVGEPVYFMNYQPNEQGKFRQPNMPAVDDPAFAAPAFYGGIVVAETSDGRLTIATGIKNYNENAPDTNAHPGASGGPLFDKNGYLTAITTQIITMPVGGLEKSYGIQPTGIDPNRPLTFSLVEPVTPQLVESLKEELFSLPQVSCSNIPGF